MSLQSSTDIVCYGSVLFSVSVKYLFLCGIFLYMYSFDKIFFSLGSISSDLALPVSRGRHGKLVDNFSHESDVTSLQDPFTSCPCQTPFYFFYCVPRKIRRSFLSKNDECPASSFPDLLASCRVVVVMRIQLRLSLYLSESRVAHVNVLCHTHAAIPSLQ